MGGADCGCSRGGYFGGAAENAASASKELREYESSLAAKAKEEMVRRLARAMARAGISVNPDGELDAVVAELVKQLPNPKHGKTFAAAAEAQQKVCRVIADVLNDEFSPGATKPSEKLVDTSLSAVEICRQVGEWAHSFSAGINTEFLAVHASVKNAMRQLDVLEEVMSETMRKIRARIAKTGDAEQSRDLMQYEELYTRAAAEHKRTMSVLKNILNVQLPPAAQSLEIAMRDHSELGALMKKMSLKPGTSQFSDTLASAISGLGTAASVAHRVHKALKAANMSIRDYLDSPGFEDLERKLDARVESGKIPPAELAKFLGAVNDLRTAFGERRAPQFEAALESFETPAIMGGEPEVIGGADEDESKSATMRRLETSRSENEIIIKDFARRLARHYNEFLTSVKSIGPLLGKSIPLTDHTDALRNAIDAIRMDANSDAQRLELSLIGRYSDASSRKLKEVFMGRMRLIANACEDIMSLEMYRGASSHFARVLAAVTGIEKTIDYYSEVFAKKVGLTAMEPTTYTDPASGSRTYDISSILPEIASSALSLQEAVNEFVYLYYVARVRVNLSLTGSELESYGKEYTDLLGDAVASKIRSLEKDQYRLIEYLKGTNGLDDPTSVHDPAKGNAQWPANFSSDAVGMANRKEAAKMVTSEHKTKIEFYRAIQAIDLYLKAFTQGVATDPSALSDIKKLLDGAQVITRWFNKKTGDSVWEAFEQSGSTDGTGQKAANIASNIDGSLHYYQGLQTVIATANTAHVGVPDIGITIDMTRPDNAVTTAKKAVVAAFDNFQALKNLINAFARIGDAFGGRELQSAVFMSPSQIYKALLDYLKQSAMSINAKTTPLAGAVAGAVAVAANYDLQAPGMKTLLDERNDEIAPVQNAVTPWQVYFGTIDVSAAGARTAQNVGGNYETEDVFFKRTIKAIAAKILTVLGVYDMFERTGPIYQLTPVRIIVGGAGAVVKPIEEAAELYYRLPRLAEFYYGMFNWETASASSTGDKIALLADFEGVFTGLIRFVFLRTLAQKTGDYSDNEVQVLVSEINQIYQHYKELKAEGVVGTVINEFIKEINRRYGIVKKADYEAFIDSMRKQLTSVAALENNTNYAILPGEGDVEVARRAPSDRFYARDWERSVERDPFASRPTIGAYQDALEAFRTRLFQKLELAKTLPGFSENTTMEMIKLAKRDMGKGDDAAKLQLAAQLIRSEQFIGDASKSFIFHETVVVGLNMLSAIEAVLRRFSLRMLAMDTVEIEAAVMQAIYAFTVGGQLGVGAGAGAAWPTPGRAAVVDHPWRQMQALLNHSTLKDSNSQEYGTDFQNENPFGSLISEFMIDAHNANYFNAAAGPTNYRGRSGLPFDATSVNAWTFASARFAVAFPGLGANFNPGDKKYTDVLTGSEFTAAYGSLPAGVNADAVADALRGARYLARLITDYQRIMKVFLEEVFAISSASGGLVNVSISQDGMRLSYGKLQETVERILADVKAQMDALRPSLTRDTIARYEGRGVPETEVPVGSIQWVEKNLMDTFFRNQDVYMDPASAHRRMTMEGLSKKVRTIYQGLIRKHKTVLHTNAGATIAGAGAALTPDSMTGLSAEQEASRVEWYGSTIAGLVYYDATMIDSGIDHGEGNIGAGIAIAPLPTASVLGSLIAIQRPIDAGPVLVPAVMPLAPLAKNAGLPAAAARFPIYDPAADTTAAETRSLMFSYNQIVARFLQTFMDTAAGSRIYLNLINAFANGTASGSVFNPVGGAHPDLSVAGLSFGLRGDPRPGTVLVASLAWVLQRLIRDSNPSTQISDHLIATLTDVPLYMKESMRANLPGFIHLFDLLSQKGDFYKQIIQKTLIDLTRQNCALAVDNAGLAIAADTTIWRSTAGRTPAAGAGAAAGVEYPGGLTALSAALYPIGAAGAAVVNVAAERLDSAAMRARVSAVVDGVSSGAAALMNSASETLRELADDPVYFQTGEGSIEQYTARNGKQPLMPFSQVLYYLRNNIENANTQPDANGDRVVGPQTLMPPLIAAMADGDLYTVYQTGERKKRVLVGQPNQPASVLYPGHQMGTPGFRMLYGVRGLLASKAPVDFEHMPGVRSILAIYNGSVMGRAQISPETYLASVQSMVGAMRWITDARCYKALVSPYVGPDRISVVRSQYVSDNAGTPALMAAVLPAVFTIVAAGGGGGAGGAQRYVDNGSPLRNLHPYWYTTKNGIIDDVREFNIATNVGSLLDALQIVTPSNNTAGRLPMFYPNAAYAIRLSTSLERTLQVVESSDQTSEIQVISKTVWTRVSQPFAGSVTFTSREREQILSLIEMNVIPINVHALMRGVPLANIYNYEASFDQFAAQMLGEKAVAQPRNARQMMLKLLANPYCEVTAREYGSDVTDNGSAGFIHRIFRGDNGIGMGRPKFLSDQLFNKALFGSVYQSRHDWDEGGPLVGIGAARGRANGSLFLGKMKSPMLKIFENLVAIQQPVGNATPAPRGRNAGPFVDILTGATEFSRAMQSQGIRYTAANKTFTELTVSLNFVAPRVALIAAIDGMNGRGALTLATGFGYLDARGAAYNDVRNAMGPTAHDRLIALLGPLVTAYNNGAGVYGPLDTALKAIAREAPSSAVILRRALASAGNAVAILAGGLANDQVNDATILALDNTNNSSSRNLIAVLALELLYRTVLFGGTFHNGKGVVSISVEFSNMIQEIITQLKSASFSSPGASALNRWKLENIKERLMRTLNNRLLDDAVGYGANDTAVAGDTGQYARITGEQALPAGPFDQGQAVVGVTKRSAITDALTALGNVTGYSSSIIPLLNLLQELYKFRVDHGFPLADAVAANVSQQLNANPVPFGIGDGGNGVGLINAGPVSPIDDLLSAFNQFAEAFTLERFVDITTGTRSQALIPDPALRQQGGRASNLTWLDSEEPDAADPKDTKDWHAIKRVRLPSAAIKKRLEAIGHKRFDTRFVRNLFFITNVMRLVRMKLARELSHSRSVLRSSHMAVAASVTEYGADPFSPNEVYESKDKMGITRYDDDPSSSL
jgi:hypothetical protein